MVRERGFAQAIRLALDDDLAIAGAQFDLANVMASGIDFLGDQDRALQAAMSLALRNVAASVAANHCRSWTEIDKEGERFAALRIL